MLGLISGAFNSIIVEQLRRFREIGGAAAARVVVHSVEDKLGMPLPLLAYDALAEHLEQLATELREGSIEVRRMKGERGQGRKGEPLPKLSTEQKQELRSTGDAFARIAAEARGE